MTDKLLIPGGFYITLDGQDFTGKSIQANLLEERLKKDFEVLRVREPGGTLLAEKIRAILLDPTLANEEISNLTDLFLYSASRSNIFEQKILPALKGGGVVIGDRGYDSTMAYQGYGGGNDLAQIEQFRIAATRGRSTDLTFIFDLNYEERLRRKGVSEKDRIEQRPSDYQEKVASGFRQIAKNDPRRCVLIDASPTVKEVHEKIYQIAKEKINQVTNR